MTKSARWRPSPRRSRRPEFPFVLSAGERRSYTANTIVRNPDWRRKDRAGALALNPADAARLGLADGDRARLVTRSGQAEVTVALSDRMRPGHVSLPNGQGVDFPGPTARPPSPARAERTHAPGRPRRLCRHAVAQMGAGAHRGGGACRVLKREQTITIPRWVMALLTQKSLPHHRRTGPGLIRG
jgi:anaerobic selenocysteine-containing dehydrogenase